MKILDLYNRKMNTKWYKFFVENIINFFKYRNTQRPIKIFSLIRQAILLFIYILYSLYSFAVNKTVNGSSTGPRDRGQIRLFRWHRDS